MLKDLQPDVRLYHFLMEIYAHPAMTWVEVEVEGLSGGAQGTPHLEATQVRVYDAENAQLLPAFEEVPYWKELLAVSPTLFQPCTTHQDRLQMIQALLEEERIYLAYGLDWPDIQEKVVSPLRFTLEELRQQASQESGNAETPLMAYIAPEGCPGVSFDARPWLGRVDTQALSHLRETSFGAHSVSDELAQGARGDDSGVEAVLAYCEATDLGFRCTLSRQALDFWIARHRPDIVK